MLGVFQRQRLSCSEQVAAFEQLLHMYNLKHAFVPHAARRPAGCCSRPAPSPPPCRNCSALPGTSSYLLLVTQGQRIMKIMYAQVPRFTPQPMSHADHIICHPQRRAHLYTLNAKLAHTHKKKNLLTH